MRKVRRCELETIFGKYLSESEYTDRASEMAVGINQWKERYRDTYSASEFRRVLAFKKRLLMEMAERHPDRQVPENIIEGGYDSMAGQGLSSREKRKLASGEPLGLVQKGGRHPTSRQKKEWLKKHPLPSGGGVAPPPRNRRLGL